MTHPTFEVCCDRRLVRLPDQPAPWMVRDRTYRVVLRRRSPFTLPEAVVHDCDTRAVLGVFSWRSAREMFAASAFPRGR